MKHCYYPYAIRESIELALKLDGYSEDTIDEVFVDKELMLSKRKDVFMMTV